MQPGRNRDAVFGEQAEAPGIECLAVRLAFDSLPRQAFRVFDKDVCRDVGKVFGIAHDRACQRVFGASFQGVEHGLQALVLRVPYGIGHHGLPFGDGAGLVQYDGVYLTGCLQALGVFDEDALLGSLADAHHDGGRRGKPQGARAGDNQYRHGGEQPVGKSVFGGKGQP